MSESKNRRKTTLLSYLGLGLIQWNFMVFSTTLAFNFINWRFYFPLISVIYNIFFVGKSSWLQNTSSIYLPQAILCPRFFTYKIRELDSEISEGLSRFQKSIRPWNTSISFHLSSLLSTLVKNLTSQPKLSQAFGKVSFDQLVWCRMNLACFKNNMNSTNLSILRMARTSG